MKIVVFGKGDRAAVCLRAMVEAGFKPIAILAQKNDSILADAGRGLNISLLASEDEIYAIKPDLLILIVYTRILKEPMISFPALGTINLHGGPLPDYRGASVLNWQILNGETEGGVTILFVDEGIDTGDIIVQERFPIAFTETINDVVQRTLEIFPRLLVRVLGDFAAGSVRRVKQPPEGRYFHKRRPEDGLIHWNEKSATEVYNFVRALTRPYPGAFSMLDEKKVFLWASKVISGAPKSRSGMILNQTGDGFVVAAAQDALLVGDFSVEGLDELEGRRFIAERVGGVFI